MAVLSKIIAIAAAVTSVAAHPRPLPQQGGRNGGISRSIDDFQPVGFAEYVNNEESPVSTFAAEGRFNGDYEAAAEAFVAERFPGITLRKADASYQGTNGIGHVYFRQQINGVDLDNADVNVNIARDGTVFSFGSSVYSGPTPGEAPKVDALIQPSQALERVRSTFNLPGGLSNVPINPDGTGRFRAGESAGLQNPSKIELVYYRPTADSVVPAWRVETDTGDAWLTSYIQADGDVDSILSVSDYTSHSTFSVYPWPVANPDEGNVTTVANPENVLFSPYGWFSINGTDYSDTRGNNAIAQPNRDGSANVENEARPQGGVNKAFFFPLDLARQDPLDYIDFSTSQLFYTANIVHDVFYALGFNELAGNFQFNNFGRGGSGGDGVTLNSQDGSGLNNANFATPPDGTPGRMRMYIWNSTTPRRDSSLDAGVVIHEYGHGLSNRLTGGRRNGRCLTIFESRGMGEGWSDFYATAIRVGVEDTRDTDYGIGEYVSGRPRGIRAYPYSTSLTTNPLTFQSINNITAVHAAGHIWNSALYEVMWNLIDARGNSDRIYPEYDDQGVPTDGRWLMMKLVTDGLALQPCNPSFLQARNGIVDAEVALTGGQYSCEVWRGFAKRGWGIGASGNHPRLVQSFELPANCQ
ncbi:cytokinesis protein 3 [Elsinoe australis]|uniref:Extracellular metalloproteinase n=1 Tax=Elsinoe australis TaxID=40998 RepID=A0A2P7ZCQ3_9PEZI|nr:cytokinesis protein 3 [Elsinoe australis]